MTLFEWNAPGPYRVAFSTRVGGVSEGAFASLNLGVYTDDDPDRVRENRRRLCAEVGVDPESATMAWQYHSAEVRRADGRGIVTPGLEFERCDGLWTDEPGRGLMLLAADCLPVALARTNGTPGVAVLHAGWRGLLAGIVESGARALGGGRLAAAIGPGIGPCCYEVGDEVAASFRERFGDGVVAGRSLDLPEAAERALREAGCATVERVALCTSCEEGLFFSHRRDRGRTGRQGIVAALA
ncbi:MAG TPA: polyphenol oxidase family protein [Gaiellaceae bacterium]|nr:polyphenol oxidase family protein [Gaiellaceae bacterium]